MLSFVCSGAEWWVLAIMKEDSAYKRVSLDQLPNTETGPLERRTPAVVSSRVRWWVIPISVLLCVVQAAFTILGDNIFGAALTSTFIPVMTFAVFFVLVMTINPLVAVVGRKFRWFMQRLNKIELICLFTAMFVTSAFSTFGVAAHVVPLIPAPWNPEWNTPQSGWPDSLTHPDEPLLNPAIYVRDRDAIRGFREGLITSDRPDGGTFVDHALYYFKVFTLIPWGEWFWPVVFWMVFIFGTLGIFYSLAFVVLDFWARREKLSFPLAQLSESVMPDDYDHRALPAIFYRPGFWIGFAFSLLVLSWNASTGAGWILEDFRINLGMGRGDFGAIISGSWIEGLIGGYGSIRFLILFTGIGIAFLLPTQVSFSTWFYFLVGQVMLLVAVWSGFGQNFSDFPSDFTSTANFLTAQGGGALLAFAAVSLFRSVREYCVLAVGKSAAQQARLFAPVIWLAISVAVVIVWLMWNQISLFWACAFVLFFSLFTIGMMRIVAETGMYFFQANFGFFHAFNVFGAGKWFAGAAVAPLLPLYSIFFMDIKTFVPANMISAAKLQHDNGKCRFTFHFNMILCIVVSVLFSVGFMIYMAYEHGGQQMGAWFFNYMPVINLNHAQQMIASTSDTFTANGTWVIIGAVWLLFTLWIRQSLFWFPHPIGFIMLFNPLLAVLWFSFLIGWVFKSVAIKYGGKSTFDMLRPIFIGLIFGELIAIFLWMVLGVHFEFSSGISLNRT